MKVPLYTTEEIATSCNCSFETAKKYAEKNNITFKGRIYIWFEEDLEAFKRRNTKRGRPKRQ